MLQFGFLTCFVAVFPLAPLFALLNNLIEIRIDAKKLVVDSRRPLAQRASSIGIWFQIISSLVKIGVVCNVIIQLFNSLNLSTDFRSLSPV